MLITFFRNRLAWDVAEKMSQPRTQQSDFNELRFAITRLMTKFSNNFDDDDDDDDYDYNGDDDVDEKVVERRLCSVSRTIVYSCLLCWTSWSGFETSTSTRYRFQNDSSTRGPTV
jgi:hypothetical protein